MKNGSLLTLTFTLLLIFNNSLFAQFEKTWNGDGDGSSWEDSDNWAEDAIPIAGDDVLIINGADVTLGDDALVSSLKIGDGGTGVGKLTIAIDKTLTTTGSVPTELDGVHLRAGSSGNGNSLVVNGNLVISGCGRDGIVSDENSSLTVGPDGSISITSPGSDGMEIFSDFSNSGDITITTPISKGIIFKSASAGKTLINNSMANITVTDAASYALHLSNSGISFTNDGTLSLTTTGANILLGSGNLTNNGTFKGNGTIDGNDFFSGSGSRLAPGTSIGKFTFVNNDDPQDVSNTFFDIEIEGASTPGTDYDQIVVTPLGIDISNANLNLIEGAYTPMAGDIFKIVDIPVGQSITGTFNGIPEGGTVTFKGVTLYISYAGGDGNDLTASFDAPLPVELIDFNARPMNSEVKVSWTTANEENNDYFTLERSVDGRNFEAIAMVSGNGNTTEISKYIHMDDNPARGLSYYRLKQTDYDGTFSYSDIETVEFEEEDTVEVYPTAVHEVLNVVAGGDQKDDLQVVIRDLTGRAYKSFVISSNKSKEEISLSDLAPGTYFVAIYNNEKVNTFKIIKL